MKFTLTTSCTHYSSGYAEKLKAYGMKFKETTVEYFATKGTPMMRLEPGSIEINTLDELMMFQASFGYPLIIEVNRIEIYDDWRE